MEFPTHWVRQSFSATDAAGKRVTRDAYGWSTRSDDEARQLATVRAKRAVEWAISGVSHRGEYGYGVDPAREKLVDTLEHAGEPVAAVTRNRYGALVLNTKRVLFVDVDRLPGAPKLGWWGRFLGRAAPPSPVETVVEFLRDWQRQRPSHGLRVYRTAAGYRVAFVETSHPPDVDATSTLMRSLHADPLYVALCRRQGCFRARLSPKPWRIGWHVPGVTFPYADAAHERAQQTWEAEYEQRSKDYATCRLLATFGPDAHDPTIASVVALHDGHTLNDDRPLA